MREFSPKRTGCLREQNFLSLSLVGLSCLSLDAPLITLAWQDLSARILHLRLSWEAPLLLGLVTWLVYAGDRLLDARSSVLGASELPRHQFARRYQRELTYTWGMLFVLAVGLTLRFVSPELWGTAAGLLAILLIYVAFCFISPGWARVWIPRELVVSGLFMVGVLFFPVGEWLQSSHAVSWTILIGLALSFWGLGFLNSLGISCWEREADQRAGEITLGTRWKQLPRDYTWLLGMTILGLTLLIGSEVFCGVWWESCRLHSAEFSTFLIGSGGSLLGLLVIHLSSWSMEIKPVLADLALLIPWGVSLLLNEKLFH